MSAAIHIFQARFSYELVVGGLKFIYTLSPSPSPPAGAAGISSVTFSFPTCTCMNPDMFTGLHLTEKTPGSSTGTPINFKEGCGSGGSGAPTELSLLEFGSLQPGGTYAVAFSLGYPILGIGQVDMSISAGGQEYKSPLCAPMCTPPPTPAPTDAPTPAPTVSPTAAPTLLPTASPTSAPTDAPTDSPKPNDATAFGDPHVANLKGQKFNILMPGNHTFLVIPRGADAAGSALLHVVARVDPVGPVCRGLLYVTGLTFTGVWLGAMGSMEFSTTPDGGIDARQAIRIKVGGKDVDLTAVETVARGLAKVTEFQQERPSSLNQHVTTLLVALNLGPFTSKVRMVYQMEKTDFSNSLWFTASGLKSVQEEIGGILGLDDHALAAAKPDQCTIEGKGSAFRRPAPRGTVHASAAWSEGGDEDEA